MQLQAVPPRPATGLQSNRLFDVDAAILSDHAKGLKQIEPT
jgi:hypothetical protein